MKFSKLFILVLLFISVRLNAADMKATFDSANASYAKGKYEQAIKEYEQILSADQESPSLYFNLGNAYFKSGNIGKAILNYERAKKIKPDDEDINTNLKLANLKTEDKIEAAPQLFLSQWKSGIVDIMTEKEWSIVFIVCIATGLLLFALYIMSVNRTLRQVGFFGGSFLIALSLCCFFIAKSSYNSAINSSAAIITSSSVTVNGSPSEKGTKLFILHEGVKVDITEEENDWTEVKISNGNVGWVKTTDLSKI